MPGYDAQPFKVRPCDKPRGDCHRLEPTIASATLPDPGVALPSGVDHWHVLPRGGADNRGARDLQRWKTIVLAIVRCAHGRLQGDVCYGCPGGVSPSQEGREIGYTYTGRKIVCPPRERHNEPDEWIRG